MMTSTLAKVDTPIRIRGKRRGRPEEKWNYGKRRDPKLQQRRPDTITYGRQSALPTPLEQTPPSSSTLRPRKRRRRLVPESPLEALPPEVLQTIFAYSSNIMLPLTSTLLAFKLCNSTHLRHQMSDRLLDPVLGYGPDDGRASDLCLASATRLLNSRFMDFAFFKTWLRSRSRVGVLIPDTPDSSSDNVDWTALWSACQPSPFLLPPRKLVSTPFTDDKTAFLSILAQNIDNIRFINSSYGEHADEGLSAAVQSRHIGLASVLLGMGIAATTELLRAAVIDAECDERLVHLLLQSALAEQRVTRSMEGIDLLDPMIWSWAEHARENGNPKGEWLMGLLRESQEQHAELDEVEADV